MSEPLREPGSEGTPASAESGNRPSSARYLQDPGEIASVLKILRDQRAAIQMHFQDSDTSCQARILDVLDSSFLLEDVQPREGLRPLRAGKPFALHARDHGIYVHCDGIRVTRIDSERGVPFFHVGFPDTLLFQQRRQAARFQLPLRVATNGASVTLFRRRNGAEPMVGRVIDISAGGCRAEFEGPGVPAVHNDERLESVAISIPNLLELNAHAILRHHSYNKGSHTLSCGIELTEMHVTDRRRLEQFIQAIARISRQV